MKTILVVLFISVIGSNVCLAETKFKNEVSVFGEQLPYIQDRDGNEIQWTGVGVGISNSQINDIAEILNFQTKLGIDAYGVTNKNAPRAGVRGDVEFSLNLTTPDKTLSIGAGLGGELDVLSDSSVGYTSYYSAEARISNGDVAGYAKVKTLVSGSGRINPEVGLSVKM